MTDQHSLSESEVEEIITALKQPAVYATITRGQREEIVEALHVVAKKLNERQREAMFEALRRALTRILRLH
jgi:hypothetical protein